MFRKIVAAMLCVCVLAFGIVGCSQQQQKEEPEKMETVSLYLPDEQAELVEETKMEIKVKGDDIAGAMIAALVEQGALPEGVAVKQFTQEEDTLTLDLNQAFADALMETGTAGETMMLAAVVDTFLVHYGAASLTLTAEGQTLETGHAIYDEPFTQVFAAAPVQ